MYPQFPNFSDIPPPQLNDGYDLWTRYQVVYLPVVRRGELIGYLWAGTGGLAAGYMRRISVDPDKAACPDFWNARLDESYLHKLTPQEAIQQWIGHPEDPRCGGVPADAAVQQAKSKQDLWDQLNPEGPPMGEGPLIQDVEWIPDSRAPSGYRLWSTPHIVTPPTYANYTAAAVHYLPIIKDGNLIAYLWASPTEQAADYLPIAKAGEQARIAAALWGLRLSDCYAAGFSPLGALRKCRNYPHDYMSGEIPDHAPELVASTLDYLKALATDDSVRQDSAMNSGHQFSDGPDNHQDFRPLPPSSRLSNSYAGWTRNPVVYLPILRRGTLIGYLWAGVGVGAAGHMRKISSDPDNLTCETFWEARLTENRRNGLSAEQAIQHWIGHPEDPRCGGVPAGTTAVQQANSMQALWDQLNPEGPPMGEGPLIQDAEWIPDSRAPSDFRLWSTPHIANPPTYAGETSTPVHFLQVAKAGEIVAVLWASPTENAAGYLPFRWAGKAGIVGRGLWVARLSDSYGAGRDPLEAIRDCRRYPEDVYSGRIEPNTPEGIAPSLGELRRFTDEYCPPRTEQVQVPTRLARLGRFWARIRQGGARGG
ncbi:hypothetical protein FEK35_17205 [Nocardia cyriacigeorgica]|uniref:Uncharacterized protein n=1 Tax=Nocardia cyriacigeorgica TaxID=135487 RepID=A0A5R8PBR3_9NOCA|nr:hypothetical protein [Nocardia cyriacigeorgica]TLG08689.1 hypothetical protein FEK35_17205 [Nocardia cyriacigeorgica]